MPSIYHTPDGAILKTPDGKIIKEPYNFGNAFSSSSNTLLFNNITIPFNGSIVGIIKSVNVSTPQGNILTTFANDIIYDSVIGSDGSFIRLAIKDNISASYNISQMRAGSGIMLFVLCLKDNSYFKLANTTYSITNIVDRASRDKLSMPCIHPLNDLMIFDRELSSNELTYLVNNNLFNELQSEQGLLHRFKPNNADIVTFNQVDSVGFNDIVGDGVCVINSLPAGTLQQKLDFANANLFVPFQ